MSSNPELSEEQLGLEDEEEDEDVDFNPFLTEEHSPEAFSSLSSENEGVCVNEVQGGNDIALENEEEEEVVMQSTISKKRKSTGLGFQSGDCSASQEFATSGSVENVDRGELNDKCVIDLDDEDAICRRTRARYSLANFSLDELEDFLQETDDEGDLHNIDDEQEYRKFLAAVLHDGENEGQTMQESENVDDEDEDNDADFEIEIEEALDSDQDEGAQEGKEKYGGGASRRPETRLNRRKKASSQNKTKFLGQANKPLRPLLPSVPNAQITSYPTMDPQRVMPGSYLHCPPPSQSGLANAFTPHQIGQLHCLIHEHAQLLVQIFSLTVLDPSRQEIASSVKQLMSELVHKRKEALSWRKVAYPDYIFHPPYIHPSVTDGLSKSHQVQCTLDSSSASGPDITTNSQNTSSSEGRYNEHGQGDHRQIASTLWVPLIKGPVLSILDAAPISLVPNYTTDVSRAVQEYQHRHMDPLSESPFEREPLFPLPKFPASAEAFSETLRGATSRGPSTAPSLPGHPQPKKTLAAALVENTKKDSVAVAPKKIVKLAQRFYPLFNSALFPHKAPPASVANRVLFTDSEDELLAMGLMEYNTDWKAIQQRFLPCKSKHQIFVRQKNRCSSKAPENPIKAVRRMKTSPLTAEEKARIHEGLRVLKLDWMSVWRLIVPYRDPSLLPRQWRSALGTQKSYKSDEVQREKRRIYEYQRRKNKAAAPAHWQAMSEKEDDLVNNAAEGNKSGDENMDDEDEAYVHEAFLSDWRPGSSQLASTEFPMSRRDVRTGSVLPQGDSCVGGIPAGNGHAQPTENGYTHEIFSSNFSQHHQNASHFTRVSYNASYTVASNNFTLDNLPKSSKSQVSLLPHRGHRRNDARLVKLAPDLPPLNLPPSVRVISQSAFRSYHCGKSHSTTISGCGAETENATPSASHFPKSGATSSGNSVKNSIHAHRSIVNLHPQDPRLHLDQSVSEDKGAESDLQMHPLLFQAPEDGHLRYCTVESNTSASGTFSFLPENQLQANFSHFCKPQDAGSTVDRFYTSLRSEENPLTSCTIDFHPLLQRTDDHYNDSVIPPDRDISVVMESLRGHLSLQNASTASMTEPHVSSAPPAYTPGLASTYEKTNELDLEIHLSSTSRKEKIMSVRKVTEHNYDESRIDLASRDIMKDNQKDPYQVNEKNCFTFPIASSATEQERILGDHLLLPTRNTSRYSEDNLDEQSLPEIVMEHEELSDSEEETGEHVEFECEEMADSEGEESDCEQLVNIQGVPTVTVERKGKASGVHKYQQREQKVSCDSEEVACDASRGRTRSSKLGLNGRGKGLSKTSLRLSLDSTATPLKLGNGDDEAVKNSSARPNRSSRRIMPKSKAAKTQTLHPLNLLQQLQLGNAEGNSVNPTRKPRKRVHKNDHAVTTAGCNSKSKLIDLNLSDGAPENAVDIDPPLPSEEKRVQKFLL